MKPESSKAVIPNLWLERYRLNEVSPAERTAIEQALREDATLRERLADMERSDAAMRDTGLVASLAARARDRAARDPGYRRAHTSARVFRWALPLAVGATVMIVVVIAWNGTRPDSSEERIKGLRPSLTVFRQTPKGSETLADNAIAREGDIVRLAYQAAGQSYGVIVSIDGRGGLTVHLPPTGRQAARLRPGSRVLLDNAYELDDAPRWECFYLVTSERPFDVQPVVEAAKREAALGHPSPSSTLVLPRGLEQSTFVLQKEHRP